MDVLHQIHPGYLSFFGGYFLLVNGIATQPRKLRPAFLIPIAGAIYSSQKHSPNQIAAGFTNVLFATGVDYLLLSDVQRDIQQANPGPKGVGAGKPISNQSYMKRVRWALHLCLSNRGVGWKHGDWVDSDPLLFQGTESRRAFLISRTKSLVLGLATLYASSHLMSANPWFRRDAPSFSQKTMPQRYWSNLLFVAQFTTFLSIGGNVGPGLVAVALRWTEPRSWPPMFGSFSHAYTVRRFWRYTWHQMLRRIITSYSKFCTTQIFGIQPGTKFSWRINVLLAFLFSGALHLCTTTSIRPMPFFLLQAIAVLAEDYILEKLRDTAVARLFSPAVWRKIGYVWVWCWFGWSSSALLDWWAKSGNSAVPMYLFNHLYTALSLSK